MKHLKIAFGVCFSLFISIASPAAAQIVAERFCVAFIDNRSGLYGITTSSGAKTPAQIAVYDKQAKKALLAAGATSDAIIQCISQSRAKTLAYYDQNRTPYREVSMSLAAAPPAPRIASCDMSTLCTVAWVFARRTYPDNNIQCGIEGRRGTTQNVSRVFVMNDARNYEAELSERERQDPIFLKYIAADMRNRKNIIKSACMRSAMVAGSQNVDGPRIQTP